MLSVTTTTLAARINKILNLNLRKVNICSGDYLFGKLQEKGIVDKLPAVAIERTNLQIERDNRHRLIAGTRGLILNTDITSGKASKLSVLPILITYSITIIVRGRDQRDKVETDLLWFLEDGKEKQLDVPIVIDGTEGIMPIEISTSSSQNASISLNRKESWEEYKSYRIDFDLDVKSFLIKHDSIPIITNVQWKISDNNEVILAEG